MTWSSGDRVTVRNADWRVVRNVRFGDCEALDLASEHSATTRTLLLPFDRPRAPSLPRDRVVSRKRWAREVASILRSSHPYGGLQYCPPAIRLLPYQLEPALAMLRHAELRILIADDVGLGKTVEAGVIVNEVARGDPHSRTLILCPAAIRDQWARELATLFELEVTTADSGWLRRVSHELPNDVNPWSIPSVYLASTDFIKRPEALHPLEHVQWDLLVVDEAHMATPASHRHTAIHAVARRASRVVLLTATPHSGDDQQFYGLCGLGAERGADIVIFRRSRADTPLGGPAPRSTILPVRLADAETRCHRLLEEYTVRLWNESLQRADVHAQFVATVLRKRALSSLHSLRLSVERRLQLLAGEPDPSPSQLSLPLEDENEIEEDAVKDDSLGGEGLGDKASERQMLETIAAAASRGEEYESKIRVLLRFLKRAAEPAIVFTEYRDTAERLARRLTDAGHATCVLHGGLSSRDRARVVAGFTSEGAVLVATDAASEGLNLHHRCRLVIQFELPWAPRRLHQRRGRVHRIGQTRRVHEIALVALDTSEQFVLVPLVQRARRAGAFTASLASHFSESVVAAHVLGGLPLQGTPAPPAPITPTRTLDLRDEAWAEAYRLQLLRGVTGRRPGKARDRPSRRRIRPIAAGARSNERRHGREHLTLVLIVSIRNSRGETIERLPVSVAFAERFAWPSSAGPLLFEVHRALERIQTSAIAFADAFGRNRLTAVAPLHGAASSALDRRHADMQVGVRSAARELVQSGLFDRRAMRAAAAAERALSVQMDDLDARAGGPPRDQGEPLHTNFEIAAVLAGSLL